MMSLAGLLLLADSRLPAGAHVHSGGVEALVDRGLLVDIADLALFLDGRIRSAGLVTAAVAAVGAGLGAATPGPPVGGSSHDRSHLSCSFPTTGRGGTGPVWEDWDAAVDVRTPSPALRAASRAQGAALLRTARGAWPSAPGLAGLAELGRPHHPLVLGAAVGAAGADPAAAAALAVHHLVGGAATAAVRLLGLDPLAVAGMQATLADTADRIAAEAAALAAKAVAADDPDLLPTDATPLPEILAELHDTSEVTLFAS